MDPGGFEPPTFSMPLRRAPNCAMGPELINFSVPVFTDSDRKTVHWYCSLSCGPEGIRTPDLFSAIEARSQLRYRPDFKVQGILPEAKGDVKHRDKLIARKSIIQIPYMMLSSDVHAHHLKLSYSPPYKKFGDGGRLSPNFNLRKDKGLLLPNNSYGGNKSASTSFPHSFVTGYSQPPSKIEL